MAKKGTTVWELRNPQNGIKYALRSDGVVLIHYGVKGDAWKRANFQLRKELRNDTASREQLRRNIEKKGYVFNG